MKIIDLHQDLYLHQKWPEFYPGDKQTSPEMLREAGVGLVIASAFAGNESQKEFGITEDQMWQQALDYYLELEAQGDFLIIKNKKDLDSVLNGSDRTGLIFHFEGWYRSSSNLIEELEDWRDRGLRSIGLSWVKDGFLSGGNDDSGMGLTDEGVEAVKWCRDNNILLDLAHSSEQVFNEAVTLYKKPIMVSHANARALSNVSGDRNLSDDQLQKIAEVNGVVGLVFCPRFIKESGYVLAGDLADHALYIRDLIGIDHIAIGSDLGGLTSEVLVEGLESVKNLKNLKTALEARKFSADDIEKIFHKNAYRVLVEILN